MSESESECGVLWKQLYSVDTVLLHDVLDFGFLKKSFHLVSVSTLVHPLDLSVLTSVLGKCVLNSSSTSCDVVLGCLSQVCMCVWNGNSEK